MKSFLQPALLAALLAWPVSALADEREPMEQTENTGASPSHADSLDALRDAERPDAGERREPFKLDLDPPKTRTLQWSGRLGGGFGARRVDGQERKFLGELHLRADFLWGLPGDRAVRYGPTMEIRSANFSTIEGAAGGMLLIPTHPGWPLQLSAMVGYAGRFRAFGEHSDHAPIFIGTAAFGLRTYNFHSRYSYAINVFASTRTDLIGRGFEVTGGIALDLAFLALIPARMIQMSVNSGDPDEPEDEEGDYYED